MSAGTACGMEGEGMDAPSGWESTLPKLPTLDEVRAVLTDRTRSPAIEEVYKCIFCLRQQAEMASQAVEELIKSLETFPPQAGGDVRSASVLFRHECCYLLGQIGADSSDIQGVKTPVFLALLRVLEDESEDEVTRHEAAEGIAAVFNHNLDEEKFDYASFDAQLLAASSAYSAHEDARLDEEHDLAEFRANFAATASSAEAAASSDTAQQDAKTRLFLRRNRRLMAILSSYATAQRASPLGETCYVALQGLLRQRAKVCACQYRSFDPALADSSARPADIPRYAKVLADSEAELYDRYIAMFTLRNLQAARELAAVLAIDASSAALRHEIAFVLGQLEFTSENGGEEDEAEEAGDDIGNPAVIALIDSLGRAEEHPMVRHESAIALGSIGGARAKKARIEHRELKRYRALTTPVECWLSLWVSEHEQQQALMAHSSDAQRMVAESCLVALDTLAYWDAWEEAERRINAE